MEVKREIIVDWQVYLYQSEPVEMVPIEIFSEEADAVRFVKTYLAARPHRQVSRRQWRLLDTDLTTYVMIVRKENER